VDSIELFPASEGLPIRILRKRMLLLLNAGIFYEFVKVMSFTLINLDVTLLEVELGINYVLIISTNAGLWGYRYGAVYFIKTVSDYRFRKN
jgi:hypothetical protein